MIRHVRTINPVSSMSKEEEERQESVTRDIWSRKLKAAEDRAWWWKWTAIGGILFLLFVVLDLRGCFLANGLGGPDLP